MRISPESITSLARAGHLTLQVPQIRLSLDRQGPPSDEVDMPDSWFWRVSDRHLCSGRERGFLFLSPEGYAANKERLRAAFQASEYKRGTWEEFQSRAEEFFAEVRAGTRKRAEKAAAKLAELQAMAATAQEES